MQTNGILSAGIVNRFVGPRVPREHTGRDQLLAELAFVQSGNGKRSDQTAIGHHSLFDAVEVQAGFGDQTRFFVDFRKATPLDEVLLLLGRQSELSILWNMMKMYSDF